MLNVSNSWSIIIIIIIDLITLLNIYVQGNHLSQAVGGIRYNDGLEIHPIPYGSVSQTVVRRPQVVLGFCPCGPFRLNISPKKTEKIKLTWIAYQTL